MVRVHRSIIGLLAIWAVPAWAQGEPEPPLRIDEPLAAVVADLEQFIDERMAADEVPGLSVALVRDWRVVWAEGFGVSNVVTRSPVDSDSVFEIASNSKVITAWLALQLAGEGILSLDAPVSEQIPRPWVLVGDGADRITLRHLASHASGLGDRMFPLDRNLYSAPGERFRYSGVGFLYLQDVMEQASGRSLEQLGRERLFEPFGLTSTGYVGSGSIRRHAVNGHMGLRSALLVGLVPSVLLFLPLLLAAALLHRSLRKSWRVGWTGLLLVLAASLAITAVALATVVGHALPNVVLLAIVSCGVFYLLIAASSAIVLRFTKRTSFKIAWILASAILPWWIAGQVLAPVPSVLSPRASAVGSVRSTATDLATFLIELGRPRGLSPALAAEPGTRQIAINDAFSWGFGPAIQHSEQGDALWQMGITPGFRSVMLIYPDHGLGVVVMANSSDGLPLVYDVATRALGGRADFRDF